MSLKPPLLDPSSPDYHRQVQHHLDLIWEAIDGLKGIGGKSIRLLGPLDMMGLPILNSAPSAPRLHKGSHQDGGTDELDVTGLSGLLADTQTPPLMAAATRGGAMLGDVFRLATEVLSLALKTGYGLQKVDDGTGQDELALLKQDSIANIASDDATDLASAITLVNEIKATMNVLIPYLKQAQILSDYTGYFAEGYFADGYFAPGYFKSVT